jgi:uncharacterized protein
MQKFFIPFWAIVFSFISCSAETKSEEVSKIVNDDIIVENGNSLLWRIEGKGITTSYIYGTMHIIDADRYHFTDKMQKEISNSEAVIMEVGGMPNPLETLSLMQLDSGDIRSIFSDIQMRTIVEFFDTKLNTDPDTFFKIYGGMKPFFLLQAITQNYFSNKTESYDLEIMGIAAENEIPLIGLETLEQQLGFFDEIPSEAMANMVVESIENFEKDKKSTTKMMKAYEEQKVNKLIPMIKKQSPEFMEFDDVFLYDRNERWVPKIIKEIKDKKCFIAVGAAHLFGDGGLIELLRKEGYALNAVSTEQ